MTKSVVTQSSFLGGEWAPEAQGRIDRPEYRTAMSVCLNGMPVEAGAFVRRSGTEWLANTYGRGAAKLLAFVPSTTTPYIGEFTNGSLRFFLGTSIVFTTDTAQTVSSATYDGSNFHLTIGAAGAYQNGDQVMLDFSAGSLTPAQEAGLRNQVLTITVGGTTTALTLADDNGNSLTGYTLPAGGLVGANVYRVFRLSNVYGSSDLPNLRTVQAGITQLVLSAGHAPQLITQTSAPTAAFMSGIDDRLYVVTATTASTLYAVEVLRPFLGQTDLLGNAAFVDRLSGLRAVVQATFTIGAAAFIDGPYNSLKNETGTVSAFTGSITFTPTSSTFSAIDVGKHIRLFSEPPAWASGTTYAAGALVKFNGAYYSSTQGSNVGNTPGALTVSSGVLTTFWNPVLNVQRWVWGTISSQTGTACVVALMDSSANGGAAGTIPSANGTTITNWQLGTFASGSYPTNGVFHEGRLFLAGAVANHFDAGMSNVLLQFSPTDQYGNVNDNNAIGQTLNSPATDQILWMKPDHQGLIVGTPGGEILLSAASNGGDALTPTNAKAQRITQYGSAFVEPQQAGMALVFVQRYGRRLMEYLADTFSSRFSARHLNELALHLSASGIAEIVYTEEPTPIVWCRMNDGGLVGVSYRRISRLVTEAPVFNGWHRHVIGGGS